MRDIKLCTNIKPSNIPGISIPMISIGGIGISLGASANNVCGRSAWDSGFCTASNLSVK